MKKYLYIFIFFFERGNGSMNKKLLQIIIIPCGYPL